MNNYPRQKNIPDLSSADAMYADLGRSRYINVRKYIASDPSTPSETLTSCSDSIMPIVSAVAVRNENCPISAILEKISNSKSLLVLSKAAQNPNLPIRLMKDMLCNKSIAVRRSLAQNFNVPADILEKLSVDDATLVREGVASNPNDGNDLLKNLLYDKELSVRVAAMHNPKVKSIATEDSMRIPGYEQYALHKETVSSESTIKILQTALSEISCLQKLDRHLKKKNIYTILDLLQKDNEELTKDVELSSNDIDAIKKYFYTLGCYEWPRKVGGALKILEPIGLMKVPETIKQFLSSKGVNKIIDITFRDAAGLLSLFNNDLFSARVVVSAVNKLDCVYIPKNDIYHLFADIEETIKIDDLPISSSTIQELKKHNILNMGELFDISKEQAFIEFHLSDSCLEEIVKLMHGIGFQYWPTGDLRDDMDSDIKQLPISEMDLTLLTRGKLAKNGITSVGDAINAVNNLAIRPVLLEDCSIHEIIYYLELLGFKQRKARVDILKDVNGLDINDISVEELSLPKFIIGPLRDIQIETIGDLINTPILNIIQNKWLEQDELIKLAEAMSDIGYIEWANSLWLAYSTKFSEETPFFATLYGPDQIPPQINDPGICEIEELNLSFRTFVCLKRAGILTLNNIFQRTKEELMAVRNLGAKSYRELIEKIEELGYRSWPIPENPEKDILALPIQNLYLSTPICNILIESGIYYVKDLLSLSKAELLNLNNGFLSRYERFYMELVLKIQGFGFPYWPDNKELLNTNIGNLNFSEKTCVCLRNSGIQLLGDILTRPTDILFNEEDFSKEVYNEVEMTIIDLGFDLWPEGNYFLTIDLTDIGVSAESRAKLEQEEISTLQQLVWLLKYVPVKRKRLGEAVIDDIVDNLKKIGVYISIPKCESIPSINNINIDEITKEHLAQEVLLNNQSVKKIFTKPIYSLRQAGFDVASIYQLQRAVSPCTPLQWANSNDLLFDTRIPLTDNMSNIPVSSLNLSYNTVGALENNRVYTLRDFTDISAEKLVALEQNCMEEAIIAGSFLEPVEKKKYPMNDSTVTADEIRFMKKYRFLPPEDMYALRMKQLELSNKDIESLAYYGIRKLADLVELTEQEWTSIKLSIASKKDIVKKMKMLGFESWPDKTSEDFPITDIRQLNLTYKTYCELKNKGITTLDKLERLSKDEFNKLSLLVKEEIEIKNKALASGLAPKFIFSDKARNNSPVLTTKTLPLKNQRDIINLRDYLLSASDKYNALRNAMLFTIGITTNLLAKELLSLRVRDVLDDNKGVIVEKEIVVCEKTITLHLVDEARRSIKEYLDYIGDVDLNENLFHSANSHEPMPEDTMYRILYRAKESIGLEAPINIRSIRQTFVYWVNRFSLNSANVLKNIEQMMKCSTDSSEDFSEENWGLVLNEHTYQSLNALFDPNKDVETMIENDLLAKLEKIKKILQE